MIVVSVESCRLRCVGDVGGKKSSLFGLGKLLARKFSAVGLILANRMTRNIKIIVTQVTAGCHDKVPRHHEVMMKW